MALQQQLFVQPPRPAPAEPPRRDEKTRGSEPAPVWLQRTSLIVLVLFCFYIGGMLVVLPWSPRYWDGNGWLMAHPGVNAVLERGWARGIVSGLGLLDIWIGLSELIHYRDYRPS